MEVDWGCQENATDIHSKSSHAVDSSRVQKEGMTKRDVEKIRGARNEVSRVELGAISQSWQRADHDCAPRCRLCVRARTKRTISK